MSTLFISDLHLSKERPEIASLFVHFLETVAPESDALYILGDLFEAWLGDDLVLDEYRPAIEALRCLAESNVPVFVMHGNRDFLLSSGFEQMSGCRLLGDPSIHSIHGYPTLLMHGDTLCTDDTEYMKFRGMVRDPQWQNDFLSQPVESRIAMAEKYRSISKTETAAKAEDIMDVNADAVVQAFTDSGASRLIHGHTHRPAIHDLQVAGRACQRIVLGDWFTQGSVLECDETGCTLRSLNIA